MAAASPQAQPKSIRVGIGGWSFAPWRGSFYPKGLPQSRELEYASRALTSIEINATFYRGQSPASFAKWREETPDDFVFSVKAPRFATHRKVLAEAGASIERFFTGGLNELGSKLGPILWQFDARKQFEPHDFAAFLALLPPKLAGRAVRHVLDVRNASFMCTDFVELARRHGVAIAYSDTDTFPSTADVTADFVYARLMRSAPDVATGYTKAALDAWATHARRWASGKEPEELPRLTPAKSVRARDVYLYVISGAKERAPAAATELLARL